jgi:hypothetical protein
MTQDVPTISILALQGDAEATLLALAGASLPALFPDREVIFTTAWATRSDLLAADAPPPPLSLRAQGLLPDLDVRDLLRQKHDLVLLSLLPDAALPLFKSNDGGSFVQHRTVAATWSEQQRSAVAQSCVDVGLLDLGDAEKALEAAIVRLQDNGAVVALCTVFRHVTEPLEHRVGTTVSPLRERIRAVNLMAARLSQRTGCFVLDLDRALAHEGGRALSIDCFGGASPRAQELALDELFALVLDALPEANQTA